MWPPSVATLERRAGRRCLADLSDLEQSLLRRLLGGLQRAEQRKGGAASCLAIGDVEKVAGGLAGHDRQRASRSCRSVRAEEQVSGRDLLAAGSGYHARVAEGCDSAWQWLRRARSAVHVLG